MKTGIYKRILLLFHDNWVRFPYLIVFFQMLSRVLYSDYSVKFIRSQNLHRASKLGYIPGIVLCCKCVEDGHCMKCQLIPILHKQGNGHRLGYFRLLLFQYCIPKCCSLDVETILIHSNYPLGSPLAIPVRKCRPSVTNSSIFFCKECFGLLVLQGNTTTYLC